MTTVYIWFAKDGVGHTSMEIGGEYVSYWPGGDGANAKKDIKIGQSHEPHFMSQYRGDRRAEGRDADATVRLPGLNETVMLADWQEIKDRAPRYNMRKHNCATVVAILLEAGSGKPAPFVPTVDLAEYAKSGLLGLIARMAAFGGSIRMWSPETVYRYALAVR